MFNMVIHDMFMAIVGSTSNDISIENINKARKLLKDIDKQWEYSFRILGFTKTLGAKHHYLHHICDYMCIWRIPIGYISEQSVESFQKVCQLIFNRYRNQRGVKRLKYAIHQILLITSPTYQA